MTPETILRTKELHDRDLTTKQVAAATSTSTAFVTDALLKLKHGLVPIATTRHTVHWERMVQTPQGWTAKKAMEFAHKTALLEHKKYKLSRP